MLLELGVTQFEWLRNDSLEANTLLIKGVGGGNLLIEVTDETDDVGLLLVVEVEGGVRGLTKLRQDHCWLMKLRKEFY